MIAKTTVKRNRVSETQTFYLLANVKKLELAALLLVPSKQVKWGGDVKKLTSHGWPFQRSRAVTRWCFSLCKIKPMDLLGTGAVLPGCSSVIPGHMGLIAQTENYSAKTGWQRQLGAWANSVRSRQFLTEKCSYYSMLFFCQFTKSPLSNRSLLCLSMPHVDKRDFSVGILVWPTVIPLGKNVTPPHSFIQFEGCFHFKQPTRSFVSLYEIFWDIYIPVFPTWLSLLFIVYFHEK